MRLLLVFSLFVSWSSKSRAQEVESSEWLFIYYMPYDNDLSHYADTILSQLENAAHLPHVNVVIQLDDNKTTGIQRIRFANGKTIRDTIPSEKITSEAEFTDFLLWTSAHFAFEHSAIFFLDHGGRPNEIGQDLYPDSTFLTTTTIRNGMQQFNKRNKQLVDLAYLQVCSKASLETLYEFSEDTRFTLASQTLLGAPNFYYSKMLTEVNANPQIDGKALAGIIARSEAPEMYSSLTCVDNSAFKTVRKAFVNYVRQVDKRDDLAFVKAPLSLTYGNDRSWDLISFLEAINSKKEVEFAARQKLIDALQKELLVFVEQSPNAIDEGFSGISIATLSQQRLNDFSQMRFYKDFKIKRLDLN